MIDSGAPISRAVDVYQRLTAAGIECAIGGALALAYHIDDPRATQDIDLNISLPATRAREALELLPDDVPWGSSDIEAIERDDQVRIMWPLEGSFAIPLDLFFAVHEFHDVVRKRAVSVPMGDDMVKVLSATDLTIFKAIFNRGKDWVDIEAMLEAHDSTVDLDDALRWLSAILGEEDPRTLRLASLHVI